jgi:hypothetical protein
MFGRWYTGPIAEDGESPVAQHAVWISWGLSAVGQRADLEPGECLSLTWTARGPLHLRRRPWLIGEKESCRITPQDQTPSIQMLLVAESGQYRAWIWFASGGGGDGEGLGRRQGGAAAEEAGGRYRVPLPLAGQ